MKKILLLPLLFLLILLTCAWSWDQYDGKTTWTVKVTTDETGCNGPVHSESMTATIAHKKSTATISDLGHGQTTGTFTSNILSIPGRTIPDGDGKSALGSASVVFTPDCLSFYTKYSWHYQDQYQDCSGTTAWQGKRTDAMECPGAFVVTEPAQETAAQPTLAQTAPQSTEQTESQVVPAKPKPKPYQLPTLPSPPKKPAPQPTHEIEPQPAPTDQQILTISQIQGLPASERKAEYEKILEKDPLSFRVNYELAEILKEEKEYENFITHIDTALENESNAAKLKQEREKEVTERLQLTIRPNGITVPLLRSIQDQLDNASQQMVYDQTVLKTKDTKNWYQRWTEYLSDKVRNIPTL